MLRITERLVGDIVVLDLRGTLEAGSSEGALLDAFRKALAGGCRKVVLDLAKATSSDASGVSALLGARLSAFEAGADVALANATARISNTLILTALYRYFDVFDSTALALERFGDVAQRPAGESRPWATPARAM